MATILIIDDDPDFCYALSRTIRRMEHTVSTCGSVADARQLVKQGDVDAIFLDVRLPDGNGLELLPELSRLPSSPEVIIITGAGDMDGAELAITNGAWDYIDKSISTKDITLILKRALQYRHERLQAALLTKTVALRRDAIIGTSTAINACFDQLARCARSDINVIITGETGTGKELFARAIHQNSDRAAAAFVTVDCASLPETLTESILFGHAKGAFTGAESERQGLVVQAEGGTLFLDEIGELPLMTQKAFLRVLQERKIRPVGDRREIACDFRLVAATNRNLEQMVEQGLFRKDLFFRIQSMNIQLPPLRDRAEDIQPMAAFHLARLCGQFDVELKGISSSFFESLTLYPWPGNVRELVNVMEQSLMAAGQEPTLYPKHLPIKIRILAKQAALAGSGLPDGPSPEPLQAAVQPQDLEPLQSFRDKVYTEAEVRYLTDLMAACKGSIKKAIRVSGLSQSRLYALLQKHNIRPHKQA